MCSNGWADPDFTLPFCKSWLLWQCRYKALIKSSQKQNRWDVGESLTHSMPLSIPRALSVWLLESQTFRVLLSAVEQMESDHFQIWMIPKLSLVPDNSEDFILPSVYVALKGFDPSGQRTVIGGHLEGFPSMSRSQFLACLTFRLMYCESQRTNEEERSIPLT